MQRLRFNLFKERQSFAFLACKPFSRTALKIVHPSQTQSSFESKFPLTLYPGSKNDIVKPKNYVVTQRNIEYSSKKLNEILRQIRKTYIDQAFTILEGKHSKGRDEVYNFLTKIRSDLMKNRQEDYQEFWISEAYVGKKKGRKSPIFRAKGRVDMLTKKISHMTIKIVPVKAMEMLELSAIGKAPWPFIHKLKQLLIQAEARNDQLEQWNFITNAKGRRYRRSQYSRLIQKLKNEYKEKYNIELSNEIIDMNLRKLLAVSMHFNKMTLEEFEMMKRKELHFSLGSMEVLGKQIKAFVSVEDDKDPEHYVAPRTFYTPINRGSRKEYFIKRYKNFEEMALASYEKDKTIVKERLEEIENKEKSYWSEKK